MKCVVLFGGTGTRVKDFGFSNKCLIEVSGKPICIYVVENLLKSFNLKDLIIVTNSKQIKILQDVLFNHFHTNFKIIGQESPEGVSHAISLCEELVDDLFFVCLGDFYSREVHSFIKSQRKPFITLNKVLDPIKYGIYDYNSKKVIEKPKTFISNMAVRGFYGFDKSFFSKFKNTVKSNRKEFEITDVINQYESIDTIEIHDVIDLGSRYGIKSFEKNKS